MNPGEEIKLNEEQLKAVGHENGPLLIIAGAGTGKTTVITERIKYLIAQNMAKPSEILALTFTDKAAREMEERVDIIMPYGYTQMWIMTFHSFCDRLLRNEALQIGLNPRYKLMTEAETVIFLRRNLFQLNLDYFRPLGNPTKFIEGLLQHFSRLKDEDVEPREYLTWVKKHKGQKEKEEIAKFEELAKAYQAYEILKIKEGVMDFSDLICQTLKLLRTRGNIQKEYQERFKYILVDEFQDTNFAQYALLKLLAPPKASPNLAVVGDDSQSIYKFRGAAISNILQFMEDFPGAKQVVLTKNYRSSQTILDSAYRLIKHNDPDTLEKKLGISKNLKALRRVKEEKIKFLHADRVENEADKVTQKIQEQSKKEKYNFSDFAILVRANSQVEPFVRSLQRKGIPYQFLGPGMLFKQPEVKDLISYLKLLYNFEDSVAAFRVFSMEIFEIPARDLAALSSFAKKTNLSLFESAEVAVGYSLRTNLNLRPITSEEGQKNIKKLVEILHRHLKLRAKETAGQILYYFLEDSGLLQKIASYKTVTEEKRAQNISKFFDKLKTYELDHEESTVSAVVDWIDMSQELGESPLAADTDWARINAVNLLTVHSSKGLEFPVVFLVNLVAQRFPTVERREQIPIPEDLIKEILPQGDFHEEEERRLFYVGMTRAKDRLYFSAADYYGEAKRERKISPFVTEVLGEEVLKEKPSNSYQLGLLDWHKIGEEVPKTAPRSLVTYLSYSQIETFKECPLHYKYKFLLKIPTPPSSAQSFGISLHAALRDFYQSRLRNEKPQEQDILIYLEKNWNPEGYRDRRHEELSFQKAQKFMRSFFRQVKNSSALPLALEKPFTFPMENLRVVGRLDRVDPKANGGIEIIDYKTGARVPDQKEIDRNFQMTIYALAATQVQESPFGKKPEDVTLSLYFFETGEKISTQRTQDQLQKAKEEILSWAEKISTSDFRCHASEKCRYCEYRLLCEAGI